ncbi:hypothetical protein MAR_035086 [Mya arenaria]|uniref:Uncharacterized protein n=1 Tax=Mya arenaria TaxID=6604 RepID=A0ABY7EJ44_MYAAR|nr:hypothetical protein MAR_035086 [Mya arenaria]
MLCKGACINASEIFDVKFGMRRDFRRKKGSQPGCEEIHIKKRQIFVTQNAINEDTELILDMLPKISNNSLPTLTCVITIKSATEVV